MEKKRIRVELGPKHEKELAWLMEKWGLDRNATVRRVISEAVGEKGMESGPQED
jgi:hypothetical protein